MKRNDLKNERLNRFLSLDASAVDAEARTIPASLSSELEVMRWFGREVLSHEKGAVDLSRAQDGLPLLWNHNSDIPIGLVENVRLEGGKLRGVLRFSRNAKAEEVWRDVQDGMLRNISIGYQIHDWIESKDSDLIRVVKWELAEASIAPVPADPTVGINRGRETAMTDEIVKAAPVAATDDKVIDINAVRDEGRKIERQRMAEVSKVFDLPIVARRPEVVTLRQRAIDEGWTPDQARQAVLELLDRTPAVDHRGISDDALGIRHDQDASHQGRHITVKTGEDALDKFKRGAEEALIVRAGLDSSREAVSKARAGGFVGVRLSRMAEMYLQLAGVETRGLTDDALAKRALMTRANGMTTSDFTHLLANTAKKALLKGWDSAPETWRMWTRIGQVPDFKTADRTGLSGFSSLAVVPEDGEITYGKFTDRKETIQAVSYAKKFRLTYQAIKNDDLNAFTTIPMGMGRAAQRMIGDMVYALLDNTGPTLNQDSIALWDTSTHKNYVAAATAPTVATLNTAEAAMAKQTDPNHGKALNISPKYLMVPVALKASAVELMTSEFVPDLSPGSTTGKNTMTLNIWRDRLEVITDPRLDGQTNGTAAWYLAADPNVFDTIEVAFVDGIAEPYLLEEEEWDTRGVEWVVGVDFGVAALDWRGLHKYKGNT
jgi:HK97 family phage prohead protease